MRSLLFSLLIVAVLWAWWPSTIRAVSHEDQAQLLASELRCPVCQNLSVGDSPSEMANQMRDLIREKLKNGETPDQIRAYFVSRYGEWILLAPKREGFNWIAWLLPFVAILGGVGVIGLVVRRSVSRSQPPGGDERSPLDPRYVERLEAELMESER
ncbi:MAG: cytochrome c-type biogenesis protein CcmH [Acidobacteria bacterium]|nr:cytochrome c-type biogenesis protein CcmH [Acidobacteriota bacterium]